MKFEATLLETLFMNRLTHGQGTIADKKALREIRYRIEGQASSAWEAEGVVITESGGFAVNEADRSKPIMLTLTTRHLQTLKNMLLQFVWPDMATSVEDVLIDLGDHINEWLEQAEAEDAVRRLPKKQRRAALMALEEGEEEADENE